MCLGHSWSGKVLWASRKTVVGAPEVMAELEACACIERSATRTKKVCTEHLDAPLLPVFRNPLCGLMDSER